MGSISFYIYKSSEKVPSLPPYALALREDDWDDYSFKTMFHAIFFSADGGRVNIGELKIGFAGQERGRTSSTIPATFDCLGDSYFSLGLSSDYYKKLRETLPDDYRKVLQALNDVALNKSRLKALYEEPVFTSSFLRSVSLSSIENQFSRIAGGGAELTGYKFRFVRDATPERSQIDLHFEISPGSKPPTNMHVLIGRNGVGKTTLLNEITRAFVEPTDASASRFMVNEAWVGAKPMPRGYFSSLTSISFSAFDPFVPPPDQPIRLEPACYFYVGLKKRSLDPLQRPELKRFDELAQDFSSSLRHCLSQQSRREQWLKAVNTLESDPNFAEMDLGAELGGIYGAKKHVHEVFQGLSSGHAIVLL